MMETYLADFGLVMHSIFWFLVMLTVVVFVHEFGHYIAARACGVKVENFAIGFGKELFGWTSKSGTRWRICMLPFGGYVQMHGDADPASSPDMKKLTKMKGFQKKHAFHFKSLPQKAAIVFAGPLANYILAILIIWGMVIMNGKMIAMPEITLVHPKSAAQAAGLKVGDKIKKIDNNEVKSFEEIEQVVILNVGEPIALEIERKGKKIDVILTPKLTKRHDVFGNEVKVPLIGIGGSKLEYVKLGVGASFVEAVQKSIQISAGILKAVSQMLRGERGLDQLGGPIKMAQYSGQSAQISISAFIWFIALISINLGLVNLFPIPMLDGGHLLYYVVESVTGRPVAEKVQNYAGKIGIAILLSIMLIACINDIKGLFGIMQ